MSRKADGVAFVLLLASRTDRVGAPPLLRQWGIGPPALQQPQVRPAPESHAIRLQSRLFEAHSMPSTDALPTVNLLFYSLNSGRSSQSV